MENKVRILEFELTGADGGMKAEIRLEKNFHDAATESLGKRISGSRAGTGGCTCKCFNSVFTAYGSSNGSETGERP